MSSLGIKIGSEIFAAAASPQAGQRPKLDAIRRQAVLFWLPGQQPELRPLGDVAPTPSQGEITGFVDCVGDPVDVVASDGSAHKAEDLVATAAAYLSRYMSGAFERPPAISISYPSHWDDDVLNAFARSLEHVGLSAARRVSECQAILARARDMRGIPAAGTVVVYDLGGNGLSLTLAAVGTWEPIGRTMRNTDFGGAQIDYSTLRHILDLIEGEISDLNYDDPAVVRDLAVLRDKCRVAKETLSTETATIVEVELGRFRDDIRLVRSELDEMISEPIQHSADLVRELLQANKIEAQSLSGIVLAGGGAAIPLVTEFLSSEFGVPVTRDQDPGLTSALGAVLAASAEPARTSRPPTAPSPPPRIVRPTLTSHDNPLTADRNGRPATMPTPQPPRTKPAADAAKPPADEVKAPADPAKLSADEVDAPSTAFPPAPPLPGRSTPSRSSGDKPESDRKLPVPKIAAAAAILAILVAVALTLGRNVIMPDTKLTGDTETTTSTPAVPQGAQMTPEVAPPPPPVPPPPVEQQQQVETRWMQSPPQPKAPKEPPRCADDSQPPCTTTPTTTHPPPQHPPPQHPPPQHPPPQHQPPQHPPPQRRGSSKSRGRRRASSRESKTQGRPRRRNPKIR